MNILNKLKLLVDKYCYELDPYSDEIILKRSIINIQFPEIEDFIIKNSSYIDNKFTNKFEKVYDCNFEFEPKLATNIINIINNKSISVEEYGKLYEENLNDDKIYKNTYNDISETLRILEINNEVELLEDIYFTIYHFANKNNDKSYVVTIISRGPVYRDFTDYKFFKSKEYQYRFWGE